MAQQINTSAARMEAYDSLPPQIREAYNACARRLDVIELAKQVKMGWPVDRLLMAIRQFPRGPVRQSPKHGS